MEEIALKLKQQRAKFGLTLEQVERETLVRSNVIEALEENNISLLPAPYVNSFIKTLSSFYDRLNKDSSQVQEIKSKNSEITNKTKAKKDNTQTDEKIDSFSKKQPTKQIIINENEFEPFRKSKTENIANVENIDDSKENIENGENFVNAENFDKVNVEEIKSEETNSEEIKNVFNQKPINKSHNQDTINSEEIKYSEEIKSENIQKTDETFSTVNKATVSEITENSETTQDNSDNTETNTEAEQNKESIPKTQFRKKDFRQRTNSKIRDILIYVALVIFFFSIVFFVFLYDENDFNFTTIMNFFSNSDVITNMKKEALIVTNDTVLEIKDDKLIQHFAPLDSMVLEARCKDSAWVKVEIDGKKVDELLMTRKMHNRWTAFEKIILSTSNVGRIDFYLNGNLLPRLGTKGSLVKSIVITHTGIANFAPLENHSESIPVGDLNIDQYKVISSADSTKNAKKKSQKGKNDTLKRKPILDFSTPTRTKPPILE